MIYWNGCSFVQAHEIKDLSDSFVNIVSEHFDQKFYRNSKIGGSNDRIWRVSTDDCLRKKPSLAIIVWSGINRFEYLGKRDDTWRSAVWLEHKMNYDTLELSPDSEVYFHHTLKRPEWEALNGYATKIRYATYNLIYTLHYMISLKYFFEAQKIPYLFYNMSDGQYGRILDRLDEARREGANIDWDIVHMTKDDYMRELPHMKEEAFYDMCKRHKVPFGPKDHPLEEGHRIMAKRIIDDIYKYELDKKIN